MKTIKRGTYIQIKTKKELIEQYSIQGLHFSNALTDASYSLGINLGFVNEMICYLGRIYKIKAKDSNIKDSYWLEGTDNIQPWLWHKDWFKVLPN